MLGRVLYEDNHLLVVIKPPGVPTQGDASGDPSLLDLARAYLKERYQKPGEVYLGMVHRLDRPTGGVIVLGRTSKAASRLSDQFRQRTVRKTYLAVCRGVPHPPQARLVHYLKKLPGVNRMVALEKDKSGSQRAELSYRWLQSSADGRQSLLEVEPLTGRQHQIRVQLARIDHPLMHDVKYSDRRSQGGVVPAIGLWAYRLELTHPTTGRRLHFEALPEPTPGSPWYPFAALLRAGEEQVEEKAAPEDRGRPKGAANPNQNSRRRPPRRGTRSR